MAKSRSTTPGTTFDVVGTTAKAVYVSKITVYQATDGASASTFLALYNTTAANVTLGTTTPDLVILIPRSTRQGNYGQYTVDFGKGMRFDVACSAAVATAFNGAVGATTTAPALVDIDWEYA